MMSPFGARPRVGLDLGTETVTVSLVQGSVERGAEVLRLVQIPRRELADNGAGGFAVALRRRLDAEGFPASNIVLGLPAQSSILRYLMVPPAPPWRIDLLIEYEVAEIAERMGESLCAGWRVESVGGDVSERPLLLVLGKELEINELLGELAGAGLQVVSAVPYAEALVRGWVAFGSTPPGDGVEVLVEVGARFTHVVISIDGQLLFARQASFGGQHFSAALAERVNASSGDLEKLKRGCTGLKQAGTRLDFSEALRAPAGQLVNLIRGAITTAEAQLKMGKLVVKRVSLSGGGALLRALDQYVGQAVGAPVSPMRLSGVLDPAVEELVSTGIGGVLPALGLGAITPVTTTSGNAGEDGVLEVLPQAVRSHREFWNEKVYLFGGAALLVVFLILQLVAGLSQSSERRNHLAKLEEQVKKLEGDSLAFEERRKRQQSLESRRQGLDAYVNAGAFYGRLLSFMGTGLSDLIHVVAVREDKGKGEGAAASLELEGLADNINRTAVDLIDELDRTLSEQLFVGDVTLLTEYSRHEPERNAYRFRLKIEAPGTGKEK